MLVLSLFVMCFYSSCRKNVLLLCHDMAGYLTVVCCFFRCLLKLRCVTLYSFEYLHPPTALESYDDECSSSVNMTAVSTSYFCFKIRDTMNV